MFAVSDPIVKLSSQTMWWKAAKWKGVWFGGKHLPRKKEGVNWMCGCLIARSNYLSKYEIKSISYLVLIWCIQDTTIRRSSAHSYIVSQWQRGIWYVYAASRGWSCGNYVQVKLQIWQDNGYGYVFSSRIRLIKMKWSVTSGRFRAPICGKECWIAILTL